MLDLNKFACSITLKEGKKKSVSIAQVKEIIKLTLQEMAYMDDMDIIRLVRRYEK